jgi:hypothetical protein
MGDERGIQEQNVARREIAPRLSLNSHAFSPNKVFGRAKAAVSSLEMVQIVQIPQGWRATAVDVDVRKLRRHRAEPQPLRLQDLQLRTAPSGSHPQGQRHQSPMVL